MKTEIIPIIDKIKKILEKVEKVDDKKLKAMIMYEHNVSWRTAGELITAAKLLME